MQYTNQHNIPLPLAVFLATDDYDYEQGTISATSLLRPIKQQILSKRIDPSTTIDISNLIKARMGTAIHSAFEKAWSNPKKALKLLGYPNNVIDRIKINPETVQSNDISVYQELRSYKETNGFNISGKFDFVAEGKVYDIKTTSVYTYLNQTNKEKYIQQGSLYRWLNPDIITRDDMCIIFIFTDWNKKDSLTNPNYPKQQALFQNLQLMSLDQTQKFVEDKLSQLKKYKDKPEQEIPPCTDEELWRSPTVWKYYKNPNSSKATKNFDNKSDAYIRLAQDKNVGIVKEVKGQVKACKYCPANTICNQAQQLIQKGDLIL